MGHRDRTDEGQRADVDLPSVASVRLAQVDAASQRHVERIAADLDDRQVPFPRTTANDDHHLIAHPYHLTVELDPAVPVDDRGPLESPGSRRAGRWSESCFAGSVGPHPMRPLIELQAGAEEFEPSGRERRLSFTRLRDDVGRKQTAADRLDLEDPASDRQRSRRRIGRLLDQRSFSFDRDFLDFVRSIRRNHPRPDIGSGDLHPTAFGAASRRGAQLKTAGWGRSRRIRRTSSVADRGRAALSDRSVSRSPEDLESIGRSGKLRRVDPDLPFGQHLVGLQFGPPFVTTIAGRPSRDARRHLSNPEMEFACVEPTLAPHRQTRAAVQRQCIEPVVRPEEHLLVPANFERLDLPRCSATQPPCADRAGSPQSPRIVDVVFETRCLELETVMLQQHPPLVLQADPSIDRIEGEQ